MLIFFCLIYSQGCRIHATVRKQLLYLFQDKIVEGEVYKMAYFGVVPNLGSYRSTVHDYKLVFQMKTKIQKAESSTIPLYGLSFTKCADLKNSREESVFLVGTDEYRRYFGFNFFFIFIYMICLFIDS